MLTLAELPWRSQDRSCTRRRPWRPELDPVRSGSGGGRWFLDFRILCLDPLFRDSCVTCASRLWLRFIGTSSISSRSFPGGWQGASSKVQTRAMRAVCGFGALALACRAAAASLGAFARYQCSQDAREHTRDRRGFEFGVCRLKLRKPRQAAYGATRPEHHGCPFRSRNLPQSSMKPIRGGRGSGYVSTRGKRPSQCRSPQRAQPTRGKS